MSTSNTNLPDKNFFEIQQKFIKWMQIKGIVNWRQIHRTCLQLLADLNDNVVQQYGNYPEYKIFMPLLRNGKCEVSFALNNLSFVYLTKTAEFNNSDNFFDPLLVLNNFPELNQIINTYKTKNDIELNYKCDLSDYSYQSITKFRNEIGIYKYKNEVFYPTFVYNGKRIKQIPDYNKNIDSINIARCFSRINTCKFFLYNEKKQYLYCNNYSELPILITRALILFDKEQLSDKKYSYPLSLKVPYKKIPKNAVYEIKRIFGQNSVGECDD